MLQSCDKKNLLNRKLVDNGATGSSSIYDSDGTLDSDRIVTGNSNDLSFDGLGAFDVEATSYTLSSLTGSGDSSVEISSAGVLSRGLNVRQTRYTPTYSSFTNISAITITHDAFGTAIGDTVNFSVSCVARAVAAGIASFRISVPWLPDNDWSLLGGNSNQAVGQGILETGNAYANVIFKADSTSKTYRASFVATGPGTNLVKVQGSYRIDN